MTTADERIRNLIWGREALAELALDDLLPPDWRDEAAALLSGYPTPMRLQDTDDLQELQDEFIKVLSETKWFLMRVRAHPSSTAQRQYGLRVILRHFV